LFPWMHWGEEAQPLTEIEPRREPRPQKTAPRLRDGSLTLFTPALISAPVHASRLVRKFEARPIAAQPRMITAGAAVIMMMLQAGVIAKLVLQDRVEARSSFETASMRPPVRAGLSSVPSPW
jgi:hypothetical protein